MFQLPELILFSLLSLVVVMPVWWAWRFAWLYLRCQPSPDPPDPGLPRVAVLLPLRGVDPFLGTCLRGLLRQNYPNYCIHLVVDSAADPARELVAGILNEVRPDGVKVCISALREPLPNCSLKVSAHIQALTEIDADVEVIALIDADANPSADWLRELVGPLRDPDIAAVNSNRWFVPGQAGWGSLVRRLWNAASISQMYRFDMPWGGSLAFRSDLHRNHRLIEHWRRCFCDDSGIAAVLRERRLRLAYAPAATMINREAIDFGSCIQWLHRQLLCPRLDMNWWPTMLAANVALLAALGLTTTFLLLGCWNHNAAWIAWMGGLLALYGLGLFGALVVVELAICRILRAPRRQPLALCFSWKMPLAFVLAHLVNLVCFAMALSMKRVNWRGVTYTVDGPGQVQLIEYRPYTGPANSGPSAERSIL